MHKPDIPPALPADACPDTLQFAGALPAIPLPQAIRLEEIAQRGWTVVPGFMDGATCERMRANYADDALYRSTVTMQRHGFGAGEYRYFRYPLPATLQTLRESLYRVLVPLANEWRAVRGLDALPDEHADYLAMCHAAGQARPTLLILRYGPGDYNRLHQDLYGDLVFPMQAVVMLSRPGSDFRGGELVLVEQKPRAQSRPQVVPLSLGDAAIFAVNEFPVLGARGHYHLKLRHGVSEVLDGDRMTCGLIFHDAR